MVEEQLIARGVDSPRVLAVLGELPRHHFVDEALASRAYADGPLPIGYGQTISQPFIVALTLQALSLKPTDRVLEIGFGCGYQTAALAQMAAQVYAIERVPDLFDKGRRHLKEFRFANVFLKLGDGHLGWEEFAPFDAIVLAAYAPQVPTRLKNQLATGGRLVAPLGDAVGQSLVLFTKKTDGAVNRRPLANCRFVPLVKGLSAR
ncbi:MAG: protein-L-isoaspartate(D-aspartate) O-methyltransferase [Deltaproteobacteria bacterium]|jgi:protein-L-isoaspartate(D-aspartate) O-methyltransferase|nr:protein-L-isoaspartate(D-aspartate) O-methyltransferase [Deltaproteobacteria bacterium]